MNKKNFEENGKSFPENKIKTDLIIGRNAVREALKADRPAIYLLIQKGDLSGSARSVMALAKERGVPIKEADKRKLDYISDGVSHQGLILFAAAHEYSSVEEILRRAEEKNEPPFIIICDSLEDPYNLGAIIRTVEAAGAHGVIIPERRSVGLSFAVAKASAGALEYVPVARVKNLNVTIKELKKKGIWVYCADMDGAPYKEIELSGALALVVGSEGAGVSRLIKENCDGAISIPMRGNINSLNASAAAAVLIFEAAQSR